MIASDLSTLGAGFSDAALGSQAVFRAALDALARPGRIVDLPHDAQTPPQGHAASAALLLALLDPDCSLWLSPSLAGTDAAAWLRFHTGCALVDDPAAARFAWIAEGDERPALERFAQGSDTYPDQSATCVFDVQSLSAHAGWTLRGPGIERETRLAVAGRHAAGFAAQWRANHASFPRGIDAYLATPGQIVGLPRSTRIDEEH